MAIRKKQMGELGTLFGDGEAIVRQGEEGRCMYVVQTGRVEVVRDSNHGEVRLAELEPGDFFGEMSLFQPEVRSATVRALGEARILTVDKKTLLRRIREDPLLAFNLLQAMSDRIRRTNAQLAEAQGEGAGGPG